MQSEYNEKVTYKFPPCKPPEPCLEYDDYDPCESSDDITEKDLAVLLKEEKLKLQAEKENADAAAAAAAAAKAKELSDAAKLQDESLSKDKTRDDKWTDEDEEHAGKKRVCKKFIKNPFFSNRLKFSSNLPPPPPSPPPQYFPPVEESNSKDRINCLRKRRKCRKSDGKGGKKDGKSGGESDDGGDSDLGKLGDDDGRGLKDGWDDENRDGEGLSQGTDDDDGRGGRGFGSDDDRRRRKCKKKSSDRPPCRKKESEISISLQPRQIPAAQRPLPATCPKDIPEVDRHIRIPCKKVCKKKK